MASLVRAARRLSLIALFEFVRLAANAPEDRFGLLIVPVLLSPIDRATCVFSDDRSTNLSPGRIPIPSGDVEIRWLTNGTAASVERFRLSPGEIRSLVCPSIALPDPPGANTLLSIRGVLGAELRVDRLRRITTRDDEVVFRNLPPGWHTISAVRGEDFATLKIRVDEERKVSTTLRLSSVRKRANDAFWLGLLPGLNWSQGVPRHLAPLQIATGLFFYTSLSLSIFRTTVPVKDLSPNASSVDIPVLFLVTAGLSVLHAGLASLGTEADAKEDREELSAP